MSTQDDPMFTPPWEGPREMRAVSAESLAYQADRLAASETRASALQRQFTRMLARVNELEAERDSLIEQREALREALTQANQMIRSAFNVGTRHYNGAGVDTTNWEGFLNRIDAVLRSQQEILHGAALTPTETEETR